jgi:putative PIN family toxin of toxin-antitoxin system
LRVVVDANVCVSAVLSAKGSPARILDHALGEGPYDFELCVPSQLFSKLEEVLARPRIANRLGWSLAEVGIYARRLRLAILEVSTKSVAEIPSFTRDPEDDVYALAATLVEASYLVSGDRDILEMSDPPVTILNQAQFVGLWRAGLL